MRGVRDRRGGGDHGLWRLAGLYRIAYRRTGAARVESVQRSVRCRSEEHTSELQSLMRISYAVFCLKKKNNKTSPTYASTLYQSRYTTNDHVSHPQHTTSIILC